ncbi:unnamed protein product, partial [Ectocarpus sp. 12 AP-2014]
RERGTQRLRKAHTESQAERQREGYARGTYIRRRIVVSQTPLPTAACSCRSCCCVQVVSQASSPAGCPRHERIARDGPPRAVLPLPPRRDLPQDSLRELQEARVSYPPEVLQASRHQRPPGLLTGRAGRRCGQTFSGGAFGGRRGCDGVLPAEGHRSRPAFRAHHRPRALPHGKPSRRHGGPRRRRGQRRRRAELDAQRHDARPHGRRHE